jgi:cobalt-precorrin-5B (C1)-methyltransferase
MLDMGDFAGGMLKYLAKHPVERLTIGGGIGKLTKFAQGAMDLHSGRSQVDFAALEQRFPGTGSANTALEAAARAGPDLPAWVAAEARARAEARLPGTRVDIIVIDRAGGILGRSPAGAVGEGP